jgi:hypothetical protein
MEGTSRGGGVTRLLNFLAVAATVAALPQAFAASISRAMSNRVALTRRGCVKSKK